jgi:glucose/arabinose dehydrogenase
MTDRDDATRRDLLRTGLALGTGAALAGCLGGSSETNQETTTSPATGTTDGATSGTTAGSDGSPAALGTELVAEGFASPLAVEFAPGDSETAYVVDQTGVVHVAGPDGVRDEPFLDVRDRMVELSGYEERGLLGLAFHPDFETDGRVFVRYSAPATDVTPDDYSHTFVLSSFQTSEGSADPGSKTRLLELPQPQSNHNAGSVAFGPDGYLYVGTGDDGGANDVGTGHVENWYDENAGGNGQDVTENLLGSILRIDVDAEGEDAAYGVPADNPLVGQDGLDEQYAWGFRNPWRFSFTDGEFYVADVGQNRFEEVNLVEAGGNYGWNVREATHCFDPENPGSPPGSCPTETDDGQPLRNPIVEYAHDGEQLSGASVIGGYRYTGDALPGLDGAYVFGDWQMNGRLFVARPPGDDGSTDGDGGSTGGKGLWATSTVDLAGGEDGPRQYLLAFGRDHDDELYVATTDSGTPTGNSGAVHRLVPAE